MEQDDKIKMMGFPDSETNIVKTENAFILKNPKPPIGFVVCHVYYLNDSKHKHTDFYMCGNTNSADILVSSLLDT